MGWTEQSAFGERPSVAVAYCCVSKCRQELEPDTRGRHLARALEGEREDLRRSRSHVPLAEQTRASSRRACALALHERQVHRLRLRPEVEQPDAFDPLAGERCCGGCAGA